MTHTPGPWWVDTDGDYLCICESDVNDCGEREEIATLACNRPSHRHCQPANARLIAAAPDLYAVCKLLFQSMGEVIEDQNEVAFSDLRMALMKAEGET